MTKTCIIVGAPVDSGKRAQGCAEGPAAYRAAGLAQALTALGYRVSDWGDVKPKVLAPAHADAHLNLGCLEHEAGQLASAEAHYRAALAARSDDATARFDLAVALEDQERADEAREAYLACLAGDPACAEAHYNLARLAERSGDRATALRHLLAYRRLTVG